MKDLYIVQLAEGQFVSLHAAIQQRELKTTRNGGQFMTMTIADRSGTLDAVCFNVGNADFRPGEIYRFEGTLGSYQGKAQFTVEDGWAIDGPHDLADYCPATKYNIDELWLALGKCVENLPDEHLSRWLHSVITDDEIAPRLKQWPAGMKMHHAYIGGLLEHVVSMTKAAWLLANHYGRLNRSLLIAGVIMHDLAKIEELSVGVTFGYTTVGTLHGHIVLGYSLIDRLCQRYALDPELKLQLQHLVLSHHDQLERGAAKRPMTPEAIVLSHIDMLDAKLNQAYSAIDAAPAGDQFTPYIASLERRLYCGPVEVTKEAEAVNA